LILDVGTHKSFSFFFSFLLLFPFFLGRLLTQAMVMVVATAGNAEAGQRMAKDER